LAGFEVTLYGRICGDHRGHIVKAKEPLYAGDVHTLPLDLDPSTIEGSARVETSGTEVLVIREIGP
jgi:hypothetical protein